MSELDLRKLAVRRADARLGFYAHSAVYLIVNAILLAINLVTNPSVLWFLFPLWGWGVGVLAHGIACCAFDDDHLHDRLMRYELERMHRAGRI